MSDSGIYALVCVPSDQAYVGSAISIEARTRGHFNKLRRKKHDNAGLQAAYNKHGPEGFECHILELCALEDFAELERLWADELDAVTSGFNIGRTFGPSPSLTHGLSSSKVFRSWESMLQRCTNPKSPDYRRYGGKGILVCESWKKFENFYADMGDRPLGTTLDRYPDKNGNYEPKNCRWATPSQQQNNRNCSIIITVDGVTKPLTEWAAQKGIPNWLLRSRYNAGMKGSELFSPSYSSYKGDGIGKRRKRVETRYNLHRFNYQGKDYTLTELAELTSIPRSTLGQRLLRYKMPLEKALCPNPLKKGKAGPRKGHHMLTAFGRTQSLTAWSRELGIPISTLKNRIYRAKMSIEDAFQLRNQS